MNYIRSGISACTLLFCISSQGAFHTQARENTFSEDRPTAKRHLSKIATIWSKINSNKRFYGSIAIGCSSILAPFLLSHRGTINGPSQRTLAERYTPSCKTLALIPIGSLFYLSYWLDKKGNQGVASPPKNGAQALLEKYLPTTKTLSKISLALGSGFFGWWPNDILTTRLNNGSKERADRIQLSNKDKKLGYTLLHKAAISGNEALCMELIEEGDDIDAKDASGYTPLHIASEKGLDRTCLALLDKGANRDAKTIEGKTPLHIAIKSSYFLKSLYISPTQ